MRILLKSAYKSTQFSCGFYSNLRTNLLNSIGKITQFSISTQIKVGKFQQIILSKGKKYIVSESLEASLLCCSTQINNTKGDTSEKKYRLNVTVWHKLP